MKKLAIVASMVALMLSACGQQQKPEKNETKAKIAQMLMVGFRGTEITPEHHIYTDIKELKIGGVIIFEYDAITKTRPRNITSEEQLTKLVADMQAAAETKLLVSIDQEGGKVNRLKETYGFPRTVSAQYLGSINNPDSTTHYANHTAELLARMGFNLNFAPAVDLNINPENPVIGKVERSFSADPKVVADNARIWIKEQKKHGIISSLKHFPGHGSSKADTHLGLADVTDTWSEVELEPYKMLIGEGVCDMVMTSHVFNSKLDPDYPATLSSAIINGILREKIGYKGVVITDDMAMGAIVDNYSFEEALEKAINAGVDILCLSNNGKEYDPQVAQKAIDIIYGKVKEGKISKERIDEAYNRIIALKKAYNLL